MSGQWSQRIDDPRQIDIDAIAENGGTKAALRLDSTLVHVPRYCPLDLVENYVRRFIIYPSEHAIVAHVLWIVDTHLMDCWETTPRLAFMSAEKESGKTRALEITALFVPEPELVFNPSAASLIRIVAEGTPTILHDEIDNVFRGSAADDKNATLLGILNQGYRPGATVPRCVGQGMNIKVDRMPCYCPVAVAGLRSLPDTLASRSIFIRMKRRARGERSKDQRGQPPILRVAIPERPCDAI